MYDRQPYPCGRCRSSCGWKRGAPEQLDRNRRSYSLIAVQRGVGLLMIPLPIGFSMLYFVSAPPPSPLASHLFNIELLSVHPA